MSGENAEIESKPLAACIVARDIRGFGTLIDSMERELGDTWGTLGFDDALFFLDQPEAADIEFLVLAVDEGDEATLDTVIDVISRARASEIGIILVAGEITPAALHRLMLAGIEGFLPCPLPPDSLHQAIEELRAPEPEPAPPPAEPVVIAAPMQDTRHGILLPVHGMAGGAGASTLATNLAWELASERHAPPRVCLVDLDFQYGSVATYLDLARRDSVFELLTDPQSVDDESLTESLQSYKDRLQVLTAPPEMLPLDIIAGEDLGRLLDLLLARFDYVIVDMPMTVANWTEAVLSRAEVYFVLFLLDLRSAQNLLRFIRALKAEALPHEKLRHVLNRAPRFRDFSARSRAKRMAESLEISIDIHLPDGCAQVTQANDHGVTLAESCPKNALRKEIQKLAKSFLHTQGAIAAE